MNTGNATFRLRLATDDDLPALHSLIEASVRVLQAADYTPAQMEGALGTVLGVDTQLIRDRTYYAAETNDASPRIAGCGGWSCRKTLFGADRGPNREPELLDPPNDAAKIRAIFVHPDFARRGIGSRILEECVEAARGAGFRRLELAATLPGVPFYEARGFLERERLEAPMRDGRTLPIVRMERELDAS